MDKLSVTRGHLVRKRQKEIEQMQEKESEAWILDLLGTQLVKELLRAEA